jgi:hypothetical protein
MEKKERRIEVREKFTTGKWAWIWVAKDFVW